MKNEKSARVNEIDCLKESIAVWPKSAKDIFQRKIASSCCQSCLATCPMTEASCLRLPGSCLNRSESDWSRLLDSCLNTVIGSHYYILPLLKRLGKSLALFCLTVVFSICFCLCQLTFVKHLPVFSAWRCVDFWLDGVWLWIAVAELFAVWNWNTFRVDSCGNCWDSWLNGWVNLGGCLCCLEFSHCVSSIAQFTDR